MTRTDRALVPTLVFLGLVVAVLSSLGAPLIPTIAAVEHISLADAQWSLTITLLVGALATPTMGRLGDGPRRREVVLTSLGTVVVGSVLAALPLGYAGLVLGRGLQGVGLGLVPLAMATARDALTGERARSTVALLSITGAAGVGLGYPLTGFIAQAFGLHAGFWFGAAVSGAALVAAALVIPSTSDRPVFPLDVLGAVLLGVALAGLLLALSEGGRWGWTSPRLIGLAGLALLALASWVGHELRTPYPLIDLRLLRSRAVLTADITALFSGVGIYLLNATAVRFVETPTSAGYGFGASIVVAGLVLLPFSVTSVLANKLAPTLARRTSPERVLPIGCLIFVSALLLFALERGRLWEIFLVLGLAGLGVGCTFAAMPGLIVRAVPSHQTASAMSFNTVLRYIGYAAGSALSATVLAAHTARGQALPSSAGYSTVAAIGVAVWGVAAGVSFLLPHPCLGAGRPAPERQLAEAPVVEPIVGIVGVD